MADKKKVEEAVEEPVVLTDDEQNEAARSEAKRKAFNLRNGIKDEA